MKFLSITISKKLFFIFLINSVIMVTISGMVIFSFSGLSSQFDFNSDLSAYKTNLDAIRIEQSKLKGHAQSFYLNVSDQTVKEGLQNMSSSISFISESLGKLKNDENQEINDSTLESIHRFSLKNEQKVKIESLKANYGSAMPPEQHDAKLKSLKQKVRDQQFIYGFNLEELISLTGDEELKQLMNSSKYSSTISADLDQIEKEIAVLNLIVNGIAENSQGKMTSAPAAKKNISNLINAFNDFKTKRKRIIFKLRARRSLIAGKPEYETFMQKMMGGEADGVDGFQKKEYLSKNLFYQMNQLIVELDEIVSATKDKDDKSGSASISDLELMIDDYKLLKDDMSKIVNETESKNNIDSFLNLDNNFMKLLSRFKNESMLFLDSVSLTIFDISSLSNL